MGVHHVEMALVDRHVHRLAQGAAGMVHGRRHVGELHEIAEILDGGIAAPPVQVVHEGRPVDRREHRRAVADLHVARRVAGVLDEGGRRARQQAAGQPLRQVERFAVGGDVGARLLPQGDYFRVVGDADADLLHDGLGIGLDDLEALFGEHVEDRDAALDIG